MAGQGEGRRVVRRYTERYQHHQGVLGPPQAERKTCSLQNLQKRSCPQTEGAKDPSIKAHNRIISVGLPERSWAWQGSLKSRRFQSTAPVRPFQELPDGKARVIDQKHRRALGEIQMKGFLGRRNWKLLAVTGSFPVT